MLGQSAHGGPSGVWSGYGIGFDGVGVGGGSGGAPGLTYVLYVSSRLHCDGTHAVRRQQPLVVDWCTKQKQSAVVSQNALQSAGDFVV